MDVLCMIAVLRLGHRPFRDKRITTHVALVSRAFGADEIYIDTKDEGIERTLTSLSQRFGGSFKVQTGVNALNIVKNWSGVVVHLTMYGETLSKAVDAIKKEAPRDLLVIVGAEKVPPQYYELSDWNISVGTQPHSEVAALAVFLDRMTNGSWQEKQFNGEMTIIPSRQGKQVASNVGSNGER
ncbi:MAG: tRNA (cytidine(56)-2'-O)-methyltransferase [Candidatus Thermoplasmatota archaeon]|nr:tRNA (cytidine(56)-2'-O)-methyltransferase [Candidatus Thermoplasmatota archaeon]